MFLVMLISAIVSLSAEPYELPQVEARVAGRTCVNGNIESLRVAVKLLNESFAGKYPGTAFLKRLDEYTQLSEDELKRLQKEMLVDANPLLSPGRLVFVKRYTYTPGWYYAEFMKASRFGGGLFSLSLPDGKVREIVPELRGGIFDRYDLSYDGQRVVFGYKPGAGKAFRLYEVGVDGKGLRQLTFDPPDEAKRYAGYHDWRKHSDDFHPCYLPDGGICFASSRCERGVLCDQPDNLSVNLLYRMNGDGSGMRMLSRGALSESTPSVMNDGRILYTRWEYVDKGVIAVQSLWAMRPDGTGSCEVYGDDIEDPMVLIHGRAIPGQANMFVSTSTFHHPFAVGPILLLDINQPLNTLKPIRSLTPDTLASSDLVKQQTGAYGEKFAHFKDGKWVADNIGPLFSEPYPLADPEANAGAGKFFLVNCNPDQPWGHASAYGLWLIDVFGNRVQIYSDPQISCWQPMPLQARKTPPVLPPYVAQSSEATEDATVVLRDVYRGLPDAVRGKVKYLRVLEQVARPWTAHRFWPDDSWGGQHSPVSMYAHIFVKVHHGVVPVHDDGSAHFTVPANANIFFQVLDENFMEIQRMRSFVNYTAGETRSCIGCHEGRSLAPPASNSPLALRFPVLRPGPQPGEAVPRPIHYVTDVQPVLDRHCVGCHSGPKAKAGMDYSAELTTFFNKSYETIMRNKLVGYVTEFYGPKGSQEQFTNVVPLPARALGSHASTLIKVICDGHKGVKLSKEELVRLVTWADANAPYYGSYFGRRNLRYKDLPDFRPVPTLDSARGIPPPGTITASVGPAAKEKY
ncbi:MAG: hypothetical protein A2283_14080 [Lentisphaerae bacterium RIFOXYA12_FULL_48_11]|nr:MAG: hypothetical protein A2283_14080 [Lentisphaerae bacterium RIFOXYA12_FULL_48_11]